MCRKPLVKLIASARKDGWLSRWVRVKAEHTGSWEGLTVRNVQKVTSETGS